jgi:hypothetical protein
VSFWVKLIAIFASSALLLPAQEASALEREPQGWVDILPRAGFAGWTRHPIGTDKVDSTTQWHVRPGGILLCDGTRGHEWLSYDKELEDFILHVEFRYTKIAGNPRYNSGIFVRTTADSEFWNQLQIGARAGGYFFGYRDFEGARRRYDLGPIVGEQRVREAGEWNTVEVTARGETLSAWINGGLACEYKYNPTKRGLIGLEAEGFAIEFRNLKLKTLVPARIQ